MEGCGAKAYGVGRNECSGAMRDMSKSLIASLDAAVRS